MLDELIVLAARQAPEHAVLLLDAQAVFLWLNRAAERVLRCSASELVGQPLARLFSPEDLAMGASELELELAISRGYSEDDRWTLRLDGSRFWASGTMFPVRSPAGELVGFAKILRNRTEMREQIDTWQHRVDALVATGKGREMGFAAVVHELRTPLGALTHAAGLLERSLPPDNEPALAAVRAIERQVEALGRLCEDLLDVARLGAGKLDVERRAVDVRAVIDAAVDSVRPLIERRRHQLEVFQPTGALCVLGDRARLEQVFTNLLGNAAKYTHEGGHIWVTSTQEGHEAVIRVADDGVGISAEMAPVIFELFTQAGPPGANDGLGIGLALVREIVARHGGTVTADSHGLGQGSTFNVRLPLAPS